VAEEETRAVSLRRLQSLMSMASADELKQTADYLEFSQTLRREGGMPVLYKGRITLRSRI
jgi:hypothetical protein